ncbi:hypothetical protein AB0I51_47840 [Streptomyces sp. NPDC050549]|uniref:hypothetical protein n=1 Tax=Streptomyces sp. NPDC050549 TaxID=3155406 RepID=UPI00342E2A2A
MAAEKVPPMVLLDEFIHCKSNFSSENQISDAFFWFHFMKKACSFAGARKRGNLAAWCMTTFRQRIRELGRKNPVSLTFFLCDKRFSGAPEGKLVSPCS